MDFIYQVLVQIGVYVAVVIFVFLLIDFMSVKWLRTWFVVKQSRGQKLFIHVRNEVQDFYRTGKLENGFLVYKGLSKETKRIALSDNCIYRSMGVNCVIVDDIKNAILSRSFDQVSGFDAEKHESLYLRALYKPSILDNNTKIMLVLMIVILIAVAFGFYLTRGWIVGSQEVLLSAVNGLKEISTPIVASGRQVVSSGVV